MDSLLANYASSDDEDHSPQPPSKAVAKDHHQQQQQRNDDVSSSSKRAGLFNSLPPPKSSLFNSIPPPKPQSHTQNPNPKSSPPSTSLFSALPPPSSTGKKVVQFRPPTVTTPNIDPDDDEEEDELDRKKKKSKESISTSSASSFLASVPAPRHSATLGALGSGRRSMLETEASNDTEIATSNLEYVKDQSNEAVSTGYNGGVGVTSDSAASFYSLTDQHSQNYDYSGGSGDEGYAHYGNYDAGSVGIEAGLTYDAGSTESVDYSYANMENVDYSNYNSGYGDYGTNAGYEYTWANTTTVPEASGAAESLVHVPGKRGRRDDPPQIIEVKQDELIKNRPREDQVKMTGIAFGPAYQPTSSKGKPSKLHKRKHQIGSLFFDMKQKEMELAERRAKGFLTKSQTQAKYGW